MRKSFVCAVTAASCAAAALLACGGGDPADEPGLLQGVVLGAKPQVGEVFLDLNNNQQRDSGEPVAAIDPGSGAFSLPIGSYTAA